MQTSKATQTTSGTKAAKTNGQTKATQTDQDVQHYYQTRPGGYVARLVKTPMGNEVYSDSEEHRVWCEAKHVLKITKKIDRQRYMGDILRIRGEKAHNDLAEKILAIWKLQKS